MNRRSQSIVTAISALILSACNTSPWSHAELGNPPDEPALSNGMVVSLGNGSFTTASTLLDLSAAQEWPEAMKLMRLQDDDTLGVAGASPVWEEAKLSIHETSLSASAIGLELVVNLSLQPMSLYSPEDSDKTCPAHVAFDHGTWRVPVRLTRSKLGSVQAAAESPGSLVAELIVSDTAQCPQREDSSDTHEMNFDALFGDLSQALVETASPWLTDEIPASLGLDLAITSPVSGDPVASEESVLIDIRTSLEDEVTWWHWSDQQLIVGFDMRVSSSVDSCVPDTTPVSIPGAPIPSTTGDRVWLMHTGTINATLEGLWRNGDLCLDRPKVASWSLEAWSERWPALSALDPGTNLNVRLWPSQAPWAEFTPGPDGVEATVSGQAWTLELYGSFHGANVRLSTVELDVSLRADLEVGSERAIWLSEGVVELDSFEALGGLLTSPSKATVLELVQTWVDLMASSAPIAWLPPTPQPAEVSTSVVGSYLLFSATH